VKVVLIGSMYPPYAWGGAEKAIAMLAEALVRKGHNVVVVTLHPGYLERTEERNGIRIFVLAFYSRDQAQAAYAYCMASSRDVELESCAQGRENS
jgi:hypothetical protein